MGSGYKTVKHGARAVADKLKAARADTAKVRGAATVRNSTVSGGDGIRVGSGTGAQVHIWVDQPVGASTFDSYVDFQPSEPTMKPARVKVQDDGPGLTPADYPMQILSPTSTDYSAAASIVLSPGYVSLQTDNGATGRSISLRSGQPASVADWRLGDSYLDAPYNSGGTPRWQSGVTEWRAQNNAGAYIPVRASSFPTSSSRAAKQDIGDLPFDPIEVIRAARAYRWQYRPEDAGDERHHFSPMADDLPDELVARDGDDLAVDQRDLNGVLWAAVGQLAGQLVEVRDEITQLRAKLEDS